MKNRKQKLKDVDKTDGDVDRPQVSVPVAAVIKPLTPQVLAKLSRIQGWDMPYTSEGTALSLYKYIYCYQNDIELPEPQGYKGSLFEQCTRLKWKDYLKKIDWTKFDESSKWSFMTEKQQRFILGPAAKGYFK